MNADWIKKQFELVDKKIQKWPPAKQQWAGEELGMKNQDTLDILNGIVSELKKAELEYPDFASCHEGYAVLLEEVDEMWNEIKKKNADLFAIQAEAYQVAAMAVRIIKYCRSMLLQAK